jgi:acetyl/propionyl-CoA carboxylase alpha subunit
LVRPKAEYIREDGAFEEGDDVVLFYDAMLSKLIVWGPTRESAIERSYEALREYRLEGITTTLPFHRWLLRNSPFRRAPLDIGYLSREFKKESLRELAASEVRDPSHVEPVAGAEKRETLEYRCSRFDVTYHLEILHRAGGVFLAAPVSGNGERPAARYCRLSNGKNAVVNALIQEVLEVSPPGEIFPSR